MELTCGVCGNIFYSSHSRRKNCSRACASVFKSNLYKGRNNPNCNYKDVNDSIMKDIDTETKAYFLGWVASDGHLSVNNSVIIQLKLSDHNILENIRDSLFPGLPVRKNVGSGRCSLLVSSQEIRDDICRHLNISPGKKSHTVQFPEILKDNKTLALAFVRGLFDGDGTIRKTAPNRSGFFPYPECGIASCSESMKESIAELIGLPVYMGTEGISWSGPNCLDFLSLIYDTASIKLDRKYKLYLDWCIWNPGLKGGGMYGSDESGVRWNKTHKDAHPPIKSGSNDLLYDLTLISVYKKTLYWTVYDTGVKVQPPSGFYFDLVAKKELYSKGYVLANTNTIIDRYHTGNVLIALLKVDQNSPDLELPFTAVQLRCRLSIPFDIVEVDELYRSIDENKNTLAFS